MLYVTIKHLHVLCVALSLSGFFLRGMLQLKKSSPTERPRWLRALPHVNDTLLLAAGIALAVLIGQYPFIDAWLTAKFFGLVAYIILGSLALRPGRSARVRLAAGLGAMGVFGWMVTVALTKHPLGALESLL
jgi:uncharacterized membrane protein SirB2